MGTYIKSALKVIFPTEFLSAKLLRKHNMKEIVDVRLEQFISARPLKAIIAKKYLHHLTRKQSVY